MLKGYVATKFEEKESARELMRELGRLGVSITHDWTVFELDNDDKKNCAVHDANGVLTADFVVVIADKNLPYAGSYVEFGMALGNKKPVYIIGSGMERCVFIHHPGVKIFSNKDRFLKFFRKKYKR